MGIVHAKRENFDEAGRYLMDALAVDGTNIDALYNIMLVYRKQGEYKKAAACLKKLKALGFSNAD